MIRLLKTVDSQTKSNKLSCREAVEVLQEIRSILGRGDGPVVARWLLLLGRFGEEHEIPLVDFFKALWPGKTQKQAGGAFRTFKKRINEHLVTLSDPVQLQHPGDNRPVGAKTVWMDRGLSVIESAEQAAVAVEKGLEKQAPEIAARLQRGQNSGILRLGSLFRQRQLSTCLWLLFLKSYPGLP